MSNNGKKTLVVVGTGMAGAKLVEEVIRRQPDKYHIRMFGAEPNGTYNRILLSSVLGGFEDPSRLWIQPRQWYDEHKVYLHSGVRVDSIDCDRKTVTGGNGRVLEPYDCLVLATGSRPFVPPIEGSKLEGVFAFRTLEDCQAIGAWARESERAVVLGGGFLGLEAARGLMSHGLDVDVVELAGHLMPQQLDAAAADLLRRKLEALGLRFHLGKGCKRIRGTREVTGVELDDGSVLESDLVVLSCGIRPNVEEARAAGLLVDRGIVIDGQLRTSNADVHAIGECAQHQGKLYGLVDPVYEQARILGEILSDNESATYRGSRPATQLKVMGVELAVLGEAGAIGPDCEVLSHLDPSTGSYRRLVVKDQRLQSAILLGAHDVGGRLTRWYKSGEPLDRPAIEMLVAPAPRDRLLAGAGSTNWLEVADDTQICNCNAVSKGRIAEAIRGGLASIDQLGACTKAGTGCGTCQPLLGQLLTAYGKGPAKPAPKNKIELMKEAQGGLEGLPRLLDLASNNRWEEMTEDDKQRAKWHGLFFRKQTPGSFMLRIRMQAGKTTSRQLQVVADISDEFGKGFCDLTTRQQVQLRWFSLSDVPEIWRRLEAVGLNTKQTGMDNVRGVCGCPAAGVTPHELFDASPAQEEFTSLILDNAEFTNLPRKFNVTITGCLENCCHTETQDIALVPAYRELDGQQVNGFNVLVGGKQGSGGYTPAQSLDVFVRVEDSAQLCGAITRLFRDHGSRVSRTRARLAFLVQDRGLAWMRNEVEGLWGRPLLAAGVDMRKKHHVDHLGIHPQKRGSVIAEDPQLYYAGLLVPVGRISSQQLRGVADLANRYGDGDVRITPGQNVVIPNIPDAKLGTFTDEPLLSELPYDPSPIMRGLVACTGIDYCHMALIETKEWALKVARELETRTAGRKIAPLSIHWSGCSAGCGLHHVASIGLQGCRSRVNGQIVDAAHVCVNGRSGPQPLLATDLMYDVPCAQLADALEPLVNFLPRT